MLFPVVAYKGNFLRARRGRKQRRLVDGIVMIWHVRHTFED